MLCLEINYGLLFPFCDCDKLAKGEYAALADSEDDSSLDKISNNLGNLEHQERIDL